MRSLSLIGPWDEFLQHDALNLEWIDSRRHRTVVLVDPLWNSTTGYSFSSEEFWTGLRGMVYHIKELRILVRLPRSWREVLRRAHQIGIGWRGCAFELWRPLKANDAALVLREFAAQPMDADSEGMTCECWWFRVKRFVWRGSWVRWCELPILRSYACCIRCRGASHYSPTPRSVGCEDLCYCIPASLHFCCTEAEQCTSDFWMLYFVQRGTRWT